MIIYIFIYLVNWKTSDHFEFVIKSSCICQGALIHCQWRALLRDIAKVEFRLQPYDHLPLLQIYMYLA